uniref:Uncharacterized protein n=1 Tax=Oryza brachyantha TaxID=4533 RepID=J3KWK2_ORYBR
MEEMEHLARTVPGALMLMCSGKEEIRLIEVARSKVQERAALMRNIRHGTPAEVAYNQFADPAPVGVCPTVILKDAHREVAHTAARHAMADHVFVRYAARHRIQDEQPFHRWKAHHQEVVGHLTELRRKVQDAVAQYAAVDDVVNIVSKQMPTHDSGQFKRWAYAAELLLDNAATVATLAIDLVHQVRHVVALEFFDTWQILQHCQARLATMREAALSTLGALRLIGNSGMEVFGLLRDVYGKFDKLTDLLERARKGVSVDVFVDNFADPVPEEVLPVALILEIMQLEMSHTVVRYGEIHRILVRFGTYFGLQDDERYQGWHSHHQHGVAHFDKAARMATEVVSGFRAARKSIAKLRDNPSLQEENILWAYGSMVLGMSFVSAAMDEVRLARHSVLLEFEEIWMILRLRRGH